ncbi:MAG: phosphate acyltransferase PlsX [Candidatus Phytoplasma stylosanthis]|nr:phosphate acyltransferase PlsX [Candidatus Phytoplasma stylosanthis]
MIKLAVDAMGGEYAPEIVIKAIFKTLKEENNLYIYLYGDQNKIEKIMKQKYFSDFHQSIKKRISIFHTPLFLKMDIQNTREELRDNPKNSMFLALQAVKNKEVDGMVTAGPTQALILSSFLIIKTLPFAKRIVLATIFNSLNNKKIILIDAGANIEIKPENLLFFALYSSLVLQILFKTQNHIVKLLNIGTEKNKGRVFERELFNLLEKENRILFKGNEEPKNILNTEADILLSDGFTSNMILKSYEGALQNSFQIMKEILTDNWFKKIISKILFYKKIKTIKRKLDYKEIGGAILLGLKKIVIKAHGDSNEYSFYKAIIQAKNLIESNFIDKLHKGLESF